MENFTPALLEWYSVNKRDFPWRHTTNPYNVWVSEVMSHQTQIDRVANDFYPKFLERFPSISSLAQAQWDDVFPIWDGLGYYSRGKNMLKTAQLIQRDFGGEIPRDFETLRQLPGIGAYTAAAILAFAHDERIPAIDTNISRIIETLWPETDTIKTAWKLIYHAESGRDWNSAMMDLASFLRAGEPIAAPLDTYFTPEKAAQFLPERKSKKASPQVLKNMKRCVEVGIACIWRAEDGKYLIQSRPAGKSFPGHWEFPGGKRESGEDFRACVKREIEEELGIKVSVRPHFYDETCRFKNTNLRLVFHRCQIQSGEPKPLENQELQWAHPSEFDAIKFLKTNAKALEKLKEMRGGQKEN